MDVDTYLDLVEVFYYASDKIDEAAWISAVMATFDDMESELVWSLAKELNVDDELDASPLAPTQGRNLFFSQLNRLIQLELAKMEEGNE